MCASGSMQQACIFRKETTSLTAVLENIITNGVIYAKQKRYEMTLDIPNLFVQTDIALDRDNIIMNIRGQIANILI